VLWVDFTNGFVGGFDDGVVHGNDVLLVHFNIICLNRKKG
jgi:hypothetical protein